jgi:hypothetical protein
VKNRSDVRWSPYYRLSIENMTELDLRHSPWNEGLGISSQFLDHQLYVLGCIVNASSSFDDLGHRSLVELRKQFQETEIGRLLLTIAVAVRNGIDQNPRRAKYWLHGQQDDVGTLANDDKGESLLSFREACNKIVHCVSVNFHYKSEHPKRGMALTPLVYLYGTKGEREWKATIDVNKLIHVASQLT